MRFALMSILVLLFSAAALAAPKVGDKIHRKGLYTSQGKTGEVAMDTEIISYDSAAKKFLVRDTINVIGSSAPQVTDTLKDSSDMTSRDEVVGIISNCAQYGGNRQVLTLLGQSYDTCVLAIDNGTCKGTSWVADVPFGSLALDISCPSQQIDRLLLPARADQGGELSSVWGK